MSERGETLKQVVDNAIKEAYKRGFADGELAAMERIGRNVDAIYGADLPHSVPHGVWKRLLQSLRRG